MTLNGLSTINIELTSRCNKACWMCGRRQVDRDYPELALAYGDMDFDLLMHIASQIPPGIVTQFHRDGEALLYPRFGEAMALFSNNIRNIVTNGKLLVEKADEIINNMETLSISVFENDDDAPEQLEIIKRFLELKGDRKPFITFRLIGEVDDTSYMVLSQLIIRRVLHAPLGSYNYRKRNPAIPEIGICWDFLQHPCLDRMGNLSICVRFDPQMLGRLGNVREQSLEDLWNGSKRRAWLQKHISGRRSEVPLCSYCEYWGVPLAP